MMKPTIHRNGSRRDHLLEGYTRAADALRAAGAALRECHPNGRDYYPQGEDAVRAATREHDDRSTRLSQILCEIIELQNHVANEGRREKPEREAQPLGNRTWSQVPTEELNATIHSRHVSSLPWARAAAKEWESRTLSSPRRDWCVCPWCKEAHGEDPAVEIEDK